MDTADPRYCTQLCTTLTVPLSRLTGKPLNM